MDAYINNEFVPLELASIHVSDLSVQRGYGIFDFFRVKEGIPLYLNHYLDRFYRSAKAMRLQGMPDRDALRGVIAELIARNKMADAGIKMIFTGGYSPDAYQPVKGNLIISQHALTLPSADQTRRGIKIITYPYCRDIPEVKTINYIMGVWLQSKVKEGKAEDVLYHLNNEVSEFPRCNFFIITKNKTVVTPDKNVLHGITRMNVLKVAADKFELTQRTVSLDDVYNASEAFLTSTTKGILPIVQVDDHVIGNGKPGEVSRELARLLAVLDQEEFELMHQTR